MFRRFACSTVLLPAMIAAVPIDQHGAAGAVLAERALERGAAAVGAAIGVAADRA